MSDDLVTLLQSTDTLPTADEVLVQIIENNEFFSLYRGSDVQTNLGPSGGSALPTQEVAIGVGVRLEVITLPTSTAMYGAVYPAPTIGTQTSPTNFDLLSRGGVIIDAGDQVVSVFDANLGRPDTLIGGAGAERLTSAVGANWLIAGAGQNTLVGGFGADTLVGGGAARLIAGAGANLLLGDAALAAAGRDTLIGGVGEDTLKAYGGNNRLVAGGGNTLTGGLGGDTLIGASGASLTAGGGNQRLVAGAGSETLVGGSGADTLVASSANASIMATLGSGYTLFRDVMTGSVTGASASITGGRGPAHIVLGGDGDVSIQSGVGAMTLLSTQTAADLTSNTTSGTTHNLMFANGQTILVNDVNGNVTIHFATGGSTTV